MTGGIVFLESISPAASTKSKEIVKSEVRSHAARISHQRAGRGPRADTKAAITRPPAGGGIELKRWRPALPQRAEPEVASDANTDRKSLGRVSQPLNSNSHSGDAKSLLHRIENGQVSADTRRSITFRNSCMKLTRCLVGDVEKLSTIYWNIPAVCSTKFCFMMKTKNVLSSEWLQHMNDEAFFHVGAALLKSELQELQCPGTSMNQEILFHKIKALKIIHARLAQSDSHLNNDTLLAILFLPFTDDLIADKNACFAHWSAAAKILNIPGRVQAIEGNQHGAYTLDVVNQVRGFCLVHTGFDLLPETAKTVVSSCIPSVPVGNASNNTLTIPESLPDGLKILSQYNLIGTPTSDLAFTIADFLRSEHNLRCSNPPTDSRSNEEPSTSNFQEAWNFFSLKPSSVAGEPSVEEVVNVAVIVYSTRTIGPMRMASFVSRSARAHLTIKVQQCMHRRSQVEEDALFWASTVAVESWKTIFGEVTRHGIAIRDFQRWRFPEYLSSEISRVTLEKFFCDEEMLKFQQQYMENFWS